MDVGVEIAVDAAQIYRGLRGSGFTVRNAVDCLIATLCLREGFSLLHRDRDEDVPERELGFHVVHA